MAVARPSSQPRFSLTLLFAILSVAAATMVAYRLIAIPVPPHGSRPASVQATQVHAAQQTTGAAVAPARQEQAPVTTGLPATVPGAAQPAPAAATAPGSGDRGAASRVVSPPGGLGGLCSPQKNCQ